MAYGLKASSCDPLIPNTLIHLLRNILIKMQSEFSQLKLSIFTVICLVRNNNLQ